MWQAETGKFEVRVARRGDVHCIDIAKWKRLAANEDSESRVGALKLVAACSSAYDDAGECDDSL